MKIRLYEAKNVPKVLDDATPVSPGDSHNWSSKKIENLNMSSDSSINDEIDYHHKATLEKRSRSNANSGSEEECENYLPSPVAVRKSINDFQSKVSCLTPNLAKMERFHSVCSKMADIGVLPKTPNAEEITDFIIKEVMVTCSRVDKIFDAIFEDIHDLGSYFIQKLKVKYLQKLYKRYKKTAFSTE